ncbi:MULTISPECIES: hypothetical protein [unclassified Sphingomonas]|uniref:hypothetical protein n=1 Tax=unclassified Sphingomonas TaxID=196159 RepID=UPI00226AF7F0|nr:MULTISPECIES: hypothetical protein [unclassified Sphingomonas]
MERLIRDSYAASARVNAAFAAASSAEGLPPLTGHQFISQMSRVTLHISDALGHSADGHRLLRRLGDSLGYDVHAFGDTNCPPQASDIAVVGPTLAVA